MSSPAFPISNANVHEPLITTPKAPPKYIGDISHKEPMPTRRHAIDEEFSDGDILAELRLMREEANAREDRLIAATGKPSGWIDRWVPFLGGLMIVGVGWIANGIYVARGTEGDLRTQIAVLSEKIAQSEERQKERERIADRERALLNEQNRQISIQLEAQGIRVPKQ
jgi:hypothetical protein